MASEGWKKFTVVLKDNSRITVRGDHWIGTPGRNLTILVGSDETRWRTVAQYAAGAWKSVVEGDPED